MITVNSWTTEGQHKDRYFIKADDLPSILLYRLPDTDFWYMNIRSPCAGDELELVELEKACDELKLFGYLVFTPEGLVDKQYMDVVYAYIDLLNLNSQIIY